MVPWLKKIAMRYSILDRPNQNHKTHQESIPYLGGLAIVIPISLFIIVGPAFLIEDADYANRTALLLIPAVLLAIVGLYDDIHNLSALARFIVQSLLATGIALLLSHLGYSVSISGNEIGDLLISIFWLVGVTNAFNFFDNLDGGAAGITLIGSFTLFLLALWGNQYLIASIALALAGSALGFLWWNKNPAQIYLGDSGALFIGFILATSLLQFEPTVKSRFVSVLIPIFILALPIIDTSVAIVSRLRGGVSIFQGGRDHLSHRLISLGFNRRETAYSLWFLAAVFSAFALIVTLVNETTAFTTSFLGLIFMSFLFIWFLKIDKDA